MHSNVKGRAVTELSACKWLRWSILCYACSGHLMQRADPSEKTLMLEKIEGEGDDRG